jgi:hypothetical protein
MLTAQKESNDRTQMNQMNEFDLLLSGRMQGGLSSVFSNGCGNVISVKRRDCGRERACGRCRKTRHKAGLFLVGAEAILAGDPSR